MNNNAKNCTIKHVGSYQKLTDLQYEQKFTITCNYDSKMIGIQCFTCENEIAQMLVQGM